jgi:hypothetical protein
MALGRSHISAFCIIIARTTKYCRILTVIFPPCFVVLLALRQASLRRPPRLTKKYLANLLAIFSRASNTSALNRRQSIKLPPVLFL